MNNNLSALRQAMQQHNIQAWIVPSCDAHNSEYVADYWQGRAWLSGFTGSAGTLIVTENDAALWTDGRYFLQAEQQLTGSGITLMKDGMPDTPSQCEWLTEHLNRGDTLGFDGAVMSFSALDSFQPLSDKGVTLNGNIDLLNNIWSERPALPATPITVHELRYAGISAEEKLAEVRRLMAKKSVSHLLITTLDDIAWLLNLRGRDVACNPVFLSYALIHEHGATLFTNDSRITPDAMQQLQATNVEVQPYDAITTALANLGIEHRLWHHKASTSFLLNNAIADGVARVNERLPTTDLKAIKNATEIEQMRQCHRTDGLAMTQFLQWLNDNIPSGKLNEVNVDEQLVAFRAQSADFVEVSFPAIVGYAEHGAIVHYRADEDSKLTLQPRGLLLIDSGGQYPNGTTDITRTIACGELTDEEKRDYTLVLKSHIALARAKFKAGTRGIQLDAITRQPMWQAGLDYNHGTGHGVGYFLNVHEGPQSVSPRFIDVELKAGMVITNEPGLYRNGKHGIRLENIMLVVEDCVTEFGTFLKFEPLTMVPFDTRPIVWELLTAEEIEWLDRYHSLVAHELGHL